ncbi:MAG: hypothetical protein GC203_18930 [Phenylobacterium sp.]|uniref:hypothetical protein n=1 Tax=Phenylobacterium sp. TaxID=1871053 RepID=UPI0025EF8412|nr:hypothetical protein [Phenylobacterium sp.]MBI1199939.1 hypothetical protein [Phenylobacterium sp.]
MHTDQPHRCSVQTGRHGAPFLVFEPSNGDHPAFTSSLFTLDLQPGVTVDEARELAEQINRRLLGVSATIY